MRRILLLASMTTVLFLLVAGTGIGQDKSATIKKKNGEVVKGEIKGIIVQGKSGPVSTGSQSGYGALYYAGKGADIETIDEEGVHYRSGAKVGYVNIGQQGPINDAEAARVAVEADFTAMFDYSSKNGMASVSFGSQSGSSASTKLSVLGEYRRSEDGKSGKIIPTLEVSTATGTVTVPAAEIIAFNVVAKQPKQ
jgi:hypothetical protein